LPPINTQYTGRLVADGDGNLFAHEDGTQDPFDEDGVVVDLKPVAYDPETGGFKYIDKDDPSHNDLYSKNVVETGLATSGPLFDEKGELVFAGDPHHEMPVPTDPHFDESSPNKTKVIDDPDEVAATATGHTEAYRG
jgi:hypothetical protein